MPVLVLARKYSVDEGFAGTEVRNGQFRDVDWDAVDRGGFEEAAELPEALALPHGRQVVELLVQQFRVNARISVRDVVFQGLLQLNQELVQQPLRRRPLGVAFLGLGCQGDIILKNIIRVSDFNLGGRVRRFLALRSPLLVLALEVALRGDLSHFGGGHGLEDVGDPPVALEAAVLDSSQQPLHERQLEELVEAELRGHEVIIVAQIRHVIIIT